MHDIATRFRPYASKSDASSVGVDFEEYIEIRGEKGIVLDLAKDNVNPAVETEQIERRLANTAAAESCGVYLLQKGLTHAGKPYFFKPDSVEDREMPSTETDKSATGSFLYYVQHSNRWQISRKLGDAQCTILLQCNETRKLPLSKEGNAVSVSDRNIYCFRNLFIFLSCS